MIKTISNTRSLFTMLMLLLCLFCLPSCTSILQDMHQAYNEGHYILAAQKAIEAMKDPELAPEVKNFFNTNGQQLINKALYKGEILAEESNGDQPVLYYKALIRVIQQMILLDFNVPHLEDSLDEAKKKLEIVVATYIENQYQLGLLALNNKQYRKSVDHFTQVNTYKTQYKKNHYFLKEAYELAQRNVAVMPFYKRADVVTQAIANTLSGMINGKHTRPGILKAPLNIEGVNVPYQFTQQLFDQFSKKKSIYLHFSLAQPDANITNTQYYLEGEINVRVMDNSDNPDRRRVTDILQYSVSDGNEIRWRDKHFEYEVITARYSVNVFLEASLYLTSNDKKVQDFSVDKSIQAESSYRTVAVDVPRDAQGIQYSNAYHRLPRYHEPIKKQNILDKIIIEASEQLAQDVLNTIDKDIDPYINQAESN